MIYPGKQRGEFFQVRSNPVLERLYFLSFPHGLGLTWESFSYRLGVTRPRRANERLGSRPKHGRRCNPATFHICWNIFCNSEAVSSSRQYYMFWVCVCSLSYAVCKEHASCLIVICDLSGSAIFFPHYLVNGTIFGKYVNENFIFYFPNGRYNDCLTPTYATNKR